MLTLSKVMIVHWFLKQRLLESRLPLSDLDVTQPMTLLELGHIYGDEGTERRLVLDTQWSSRQLLRPIMQYQQSARASTQY